MRTIFLCFALALSGAQRIPVDMDRLNVLAIEYNRYVEKLQSGEIDVKQWQKVLRAWRAVEGE